MKRKKQYPVATDPKAFYVQVIEPTWLKVVESVDEANNEDFAMKLAQARANFLAEDDRLCFVRVQRYSDGEVIAVWIVYDQKATLIKYENDEPDSNALVTFDPTKPQTITSDDGTPHEWSPE